MAKKKSAPKRRRGPDRGEVANLPWYDRAEQGGYLKPEPGALVLVVTGEPEERTNDFGKQTLDIPTNRGTFSTGSYAILTPLAAAFRKRKGKLTGAILSCTVTGEGTDRRYEDVRVK